MEIIMKNSLWIEDRRNDNSELLKFLKPFSDLPKNFDEAIILIKDAKQKYDYIILDIDLTDFDEEQWNEIENTSWGKENKEGIDRVQYKKEAGFHIFIELLKSGFDTNRICFLSGNVSEESKSEESLETLNEYHKDPNTIDIDELKDILVELDMEKLFDYEKVKENIGNGDFYNKFKKCIFKIRDGSDGNDTQSIDGLKKVFKEARISIPKTFMKSDDLNVIKKMKQWIEEEKNKYLTLRRGVITAIEELSAIIDVKEDKLLINKYLKTKKDEKSIKYMKSYLDKLSLFLPHRKPDKLSELLFVFIKEVVSELEVDIGHWKIKELSPFQKLCITQTKNLRNWTAHDILEREEFDEELAGYLFITSMRAIFDLDKDKDNIYKYEKIILSMFNSKELPSNLKEHVAESYQKIANEQLTYSKGIEYLNLLNNSTRGENHIKISRSQLFNSFWQGLYIPKQTIKSTENNQTSKKDDYVKTFINFKKFTFTENFIEKIIAKAIYDNSFK